MLSRKYGGGARARAMMSSKVEWREGAGNHAEDNSWAMVAVGWSCGLGVWQDPRPDNSYAAVKNWTNCSHSRAPSEKIPLHAATLGSCAGTLDCGCGDVI